MPTVPLNESDPDRYYRIQSAIAAGDSIREILRTHHIDFRTLKKYFPNAGRPDLSGGQNLRDLDPEKAERIGRMVADGASLNEIMRSENTDHRTIKRLFPNAGWTVGGKGASMMASANRILK